jgi:probable F420-dependent oxidoreductase
MDLGRVGIWTYHLNFQPTSKVRDVVAELEALGYGAIWVGEAAYREPLASAAVLLSATSRMVVAIGIANIWVRDPFATLPAQLTLAEAYPERFLLGLGVSHARMVEGKRGHHYRKPFTAMRAFLDAMDRLATSYRAVGPVTPPPRVPAALGPKMLALAAERAQGAHPYLVPPEHTAKAREQLGHDRWLLPEQGVVLETNPADARAIARRISRPTLTCPTTPTTYAGSDSLTTTWPREAAIVSSMPCSPGVTSLTSRAASKPTMTLGPIMSASRSLTPIRMAYR